MRSPQRLVFEKLENRCTLSVEPPYATGVVWLDVNGDDVISPIDALGIINKLNSDGAGVFDPFEKPISGWYDATGDGWVTPIDALIVINYLNRFGSGPVTMPDLRNLAPRGFDSSFSVQDGETIYFVAPFLDPEGKKMTVTVGTDRADGGLILQPDGKTFRYDAPALFSDTFTVIGTDSGGLTASATITISVNIDPRKQHAPMVVEDLVQVIRNTPKDFNVTTNDVDIDGDSFTLAAHQEPQHGTLTDLGAGTFRYIPHANFVGVDAFEYTIRDSTGREDKGFVILDIRSNNAPSVLSPVIHVTEDTPSRTFQLSELGSDADHDPLSVTFGTPSHGVIQAHEDGWQYIPSTDFVGTDSVTYTVSDGYETKTGTMTFIVEMPHFTGTTIRRDEAVFVGVTLSGVTVDNETTSFYSDITTTSYAFLQIEEARDHNWLQDGFAVGSNFYPGRELTLGENALIIVRVFNLPGPDFVSAAQAAGVLTTAQSNRLADHATSQEFWKMWAQATTPAIQDEATLELIAPDVARRFGAKY